MSETQNQDADYPTDMFGSPCGRDYHYRIPKNDETAMRLAAWAYHGMMGYEDRHVGKWKDYSGDSVTYWGIRTIDHKGHLDGLAEYAHSPKWEDADETRAFSEYRGVSGGTRIKGTFRCSPDRPEHELTLQFDLRLGLTPTELRDAIENQGDAWDEVTEAIHYAKQDRMEEYRQDLAEARRDCEHTHFVEEDIPGRPRAVGYCEDCGAELDADKNLV